MSFLYIIPLFPLDFQVFVDLLARDLLTGDLLTCSPFDLGTFRLVDLLTWGPFDL